MELVYLWVEGYKNIREQEFNFSPRFECEYKNNKLTICDKKEKNNKCKNKDYIENFFDKNINVTAIVGENGSGKSSICNSLLTSKNGIIKVYRINNIFYYFDSKVETVKYPDDFKKLELEKIEQVKFSYDFFSQESHNDSNSHKNTEFSFNDNDVFYEIFNSSYEKIDLIKYKSLIGRVLHKYGKKITTLSGFTHQTTLIKLIINNYFDVHKRESLSESIRIATSFPNINIDNKFRVLPISKQLLLYIIYLINEDKILSGEPDWLKKFATFEEMISTPNCYLELTDNPDIIFLISNYSKYCNFLKLFKGNGNILNDNTFPLSNELLFSRNFYPLLELSYFDELGIKYDKLSHGERQIHSSMLLLYDKIINSNKNNFKIILDEVETSLHPLWQKNIVSELIKLCKLFDNNKKFQIIISSHSPFILSDLPKENVIFLKDGKQVDVDIKPFGANIHELLSHGFFMEGGLMGEFAKSKINKIKKFYETVVKENQKKENDFSLLKIEYEENKTKFEQIQSIIGEPFLKTIIKNQLEEIESILFGSKAKKIAIKRFIKEFGEDAISEVMNNDKN